MAAKPSKLLSRKRSELELNSMSPAEVEQVTLTRVHAGFGVPVPAARDTLDGEQPSVRIRFPTGLSCREERCTRLRDTRPIADGVDGVLQRRAADEPHLREQQPETDEAVSRIEFDSAELEREEDRTLSTSTLNAFDDGSESSTATLCSTKVFSEYLAQCGDATLRPTTCVGAVVETVQSRRHQSQSKE